MSGLRKPYTTWATEAFNPFRDSTTFLVSWHIELDYGSHLTEIEWSSVTVL